MFLARFVASQRAGLKPKSGVKAQSRTENDAGFPFHLGTTPKKVIQGEIQTNKLRLG